MVSRAAFLVTLLCYTANGFAPSTPSFATTASLQAAAKVQDTFAFQEMRANLDAMENQQVASRDLDPAKRTELEGYVRKVLESANYEAKPLNLPRTEWRLAFSTEAAALGDLPRDASVLLKFLDDNKLQYCLQFSAKTFGLNNLQALCDYTVDANNLVTFVYDKITTDAFGFSNIGVGFFGLLKGRANFVETAYFDGTYWIEKSQGIEPGTDYVNVYIRQDLDNDDWNRSL